MGFGAPAALGAKLARPDKVVVALVGDGGFGQNPALLATAFEEDIPVVWVIMNNFAFGTIAAPLSRTTWPRRRRAERPSERVQGPYQTRATEDWGALRPRR